MLSGCEGWKGVVIHVSQEVILGTSSGFPQIPFRCPSAGNAKGQSEVEWSQNLTGRY